MKTLVAALVLALAVPAVAQNITFQPKGKAVCAQFEGSFDAENQASPDERLAVRVRCTPTAQKYQGNRVFQCSLAINGQQSGVTWKGFTGTSKSGYGFIEAVNVDKPDSMLRIAGCKNGKCALLQMFSKEQQSGAQCIDPAAVNQGDSF